MQIWSSVSSFALLDGTQLENEAGLVIFPLLPELFLLFIQVEIYLQNVINQWLDGRVS